MGSSRGLASAGVRAKARVLPWVWVMVSVPEKVVFKATVLVHSMDWIKLRVW